MKKNVQKFNVALKVIMANFFQSLCYDNYFFDKRVMITIDTIKLLFQKHEENASDKSK